MVIVVEACTKLGHTSVLGHVPDTGSVAVVQNSSLNFALKANAAPTTANNASESNNRIEV